MRAPGAARSVPTSHTSDFNTACCESLAGQVAEAIEHLRQAIDMWDGCREMAKHE